MPRFPPQAVSLHCDLLLFHLQSIRGSMDFLRLLPVSAQLQ